MSVAERSVEVVRVYEDPGPRRRGHRVLVDRLWPRGVSKDAVDYDEWAKDVTPSNELRRWCQHDPDRFAEFSKRYRRELAIRPAAIAVVHLREVAEHHCLVLLTATRDIEHSGAAVLRSFIAEPDREN